MDGFITITGGKLMTYRLMAERATDLVCKKIDKVGACTTAILPLHAVTMKAAQERHGSLTKEIKEHDAEDKAMVCECEHTSVGEMKYAIEKLHVSNLTNLRRRTRVGMGSCQGKLCACRAATLLSKSGTDPISTLDDLASFMNERWKGMRPVAWGSTLSEAQLTTIIYEGLCGLSMNNKK